MDNRIILLFCIYITCISCSTKQENKNTIIETVNEKTQTDKEKETIFTPSSEGIVEIQLTNGKGAAKIQKKKDETVYLQFLSEGYSKIIAHLSSSDSLANIRFSQIFLPDKSTDGPFGRDLEYNLPTNGLYKLSVHENMMAGEPWSGIFEVNIELTK